MAPRTCQARKARNLSHTLTGLNNASLGDSTHASVADQVGIEGQPITNPTHPQNSVIGMSNAAILAIDHLLITTRKTHPFSP